LANKAAIAARIDTFAGIPFFNFILLSPRFCSPLLLFHVDEKTSIFGQKLSEQMREKLNYINTGVKPKKNIDGMREAVEEYQTEIKRRKLESGEDPTSRFAALNF
jgi:hypothetical protein